MGAGELFGTIKTFVTEEKMVGRWLEHSSCSRNVYTGQEGGKERRKEGKKERGGREGG